MASTGPFVLAGIESGEVWQWDAGSGVLLGVWRGAHSGQVLRMNPHEVGGWALLVTMGSDQAVRVWDVAAGSRLGADLWLSGDMPRMAMASGGRLLVGGDYEIKQVDLLTGTARRGAGALGLAQRGAYRV